MAQADQFSNQPAGPAVRWSVMLRLFLAAAIAGMQLLASPALAADRPLNVPAEYVAAKQAWRVAALSDYQFTLRRDCACLPEQPITVVVRNDRVQRAFYSVSNIDVDARRLSGLDTLSGLFRVMDEAYAGSAAEIKFKANDQLGYLEYLSIDFDARIADEELVYHVYDFRSTSDAKR